MYRLVLAPVLRPAARPCLASAVVAYRPVTATSVRFNSSQPPSDWSDKQARRQVLEKINDLQRDWDARILTYEELKPKTQSPTPDAYLIDVREPDEVIQGMIPSAVNVPLSVLAESLHLSKEAFKAKHGFEKPRLDQEVVFYCRSGVRSSTASDVAKRNGYTNIYNYKGSWLEWVNKENIGPTHPTPNMLRRTFGFICRCSTVPLKRISSQQCRISVAAWPTKLHNIRPWHLRGLTTPPPHVNESHLTMERYHQLSDATMEALLGSLEDLLDTLGRSNYEVEYHGGVLTLVLGEKGTYVVNKQPPNKQIWLSSPFSGPKRYDYSEEADDWIYPRDDRLMGDLLNDELSRVLERDIDLRITKVSGFIQ